MRNILKGLNREQYQAVTYGEGPLLIIAGAGTGKTTVITRRIAWLIEKKLAKPEEILALTFTEKAAAEMEERVDLLLPYGMFESWISTFHAFADRILRDYSLELGLPVDFEVLSKTEQIIFLTERIHKVALKYLRPETNPTKFIPEIINLISRAKDENISPEQYFIYGQKLKRKAKGKAAKIEAERQIEIARIYGFYQKELMRQSKVDFGDQVYLCFHLLKSRPDIRKIYQKKFKYVLVDEFQDTNYIQNELLKLLAGKKGNITVVGDDDQSIYKFRGAAISNIIKFKINYQNVKQVVLIKNYRSGQQILDKAYTLIKNNNPDRLEVKNKIKKRLIAQRTSTSNNSLSKQPSGLSYQQASPGERKKSKIMLHLWETGDEEAHFIAKEIKRLRKKGIEFKEMAVLLRANASAENYIRTFNLSAIPWQFSGMVPLWQKREIRVLISFLKLLTTNNDNLAFFQLATSEIYRVPVADLIEVSDIAGRANFSMLKTAAAAKNIDISKSGQEKLKVLIDDINKFREKSKKKSAGTLLYEYLQKKKVLDDLKKESLENEVRIRNIADFFEKIKEFEKTSSDCSVFALILYLDMLLETGEKPEKQEIDPEFDAVRILTVHSAKGLEFEVVFMPELTSDRFPSRERKEQIELPKKFIKEILPQGNWHEQEERRLFYVAMTRAKTYLFLSFAYDYGGARAKKASLFLKETLGKSRLEKLEHKKQSKLKQISLFAPKKIKKEKTLPLSKTRKNKPLYLSHYAIDDYLTCPLKYKYVKILRLPVMASYPVLFGSAIHNALSEYLRAKMAGREMRPAELIASFKKYFKNEGYLSKSHQKAAYKKGEEALKKFIKIDKKYKNPPKAVEKGFHFALGKNRISGRFDVIFDDQLKKDTARRIAKNKYTNDRIIDFKSSDIYEKERAKKRVRESDQLDLYALAYKKIEGKLPARVGLYFLGSGIISQKIPKEKDLERSQKRIKKAISGIRSGDFTPRPNKFNCTYCTYAKICPYSEA